MSSRTSRRRRPRKDPIPFEVWSVGADGTRYVCAQHWRLFLRKHYRTGGTFRHLWKLEAYAFRHAAATGHTLIAIEDLLRVSRAWGYNLGA